MHRPRWTPLVSRLALLVLLAALAAPIAGCQPETAESPDTVTILAWLVGGRLLLPCLVVVLWLLVAIPTLLMFRDALKRDSGQFPGDESSKTAWIIGLAAGFILFASWIVTPLYYFLVYLREPGRIIPPEHDSIRGDVPDRPFKSPAQGPDSDDENLMRPH